MEEYAGIGFITDDATTHSSHTNQGDTQIISNRIKPISLTISSCTGEDPAVCQEFYQQANQLSRLEKLRLAELLLADLDTPESLVMLSGVI